MAVQLKTEEEVLVKQTLNLEQEITDEDKRPFGLACHEVVEEMDWDLDNTGHVILMQLLKDIKNALGVRVSKKKASKKKKKAKTKKKADGSDDADSAGETKAEAKANGDTEPENNEPEVSTSPPDEAESSPEESSSSSDEGDAAASAAEDAGSDIHDPFAVPPGSQAG